MPLGRNAVVSHCIIHQKNLFTKVSRDLKPGRWNFQILIPKNNAACVQKLRDEFTRRFPGFRRDEIKVRLLILLIWQWTTVLTIAKWNLFNCKLTWTPKGDILKIVWWSLTKSMFVETFPIGHVMQEKLSPTLVAPTAVSNSLKNESHQNQMSKSAD